MIDTIVFELHDIEQHRDIYNQLKKNQDIEKFGGKIPKDYLNSDENNNLTYKQIIYKYRTLELVKGKLFQKSSHRYISWTYLPSSDCISFNFSIPKFLYGHNVSEFVPTPNELTFNYAFHQSLKSQKKILHSRIMAIIRKFFVLNFNINDVNSDGEVVNFIDWTKIKLRRFDLCFNLYHDNKADALNHLNLLRKLKKKNTSLYDTNKTNYDTSFTHLNENYYFKVYHKGTEFKKNDAKELYKLNQERLNLKLPKKYDVEFLQLQSDKIIRFEMGFRDSYINYLHKRSTFRERCKHHKKELKRYRRLRRISRMSFKTIQNTFKDFRKRNIEVIALKKTAKYLGTEFYYTRSVILNNQNKKSGIEDLMLLQKNDKIFYQNFVKMLELKTDFWLEAPYNEDLTYHECKIQDDLNNDPSNYKKSYYWSENITNVCIEKFISLINEYKIETLPTIVNLELNHKAYNDKVVLNNKDVKNIKHLLPQSELNKLKKRKINASRILPILALIEAGYTIDDIRKKMNIPDSTYYRLKSDLKKIGWSSKQVNATIPKVNYSYLPYQQYALKYGRKYNLI